MPLNQVESGSIKPIDQKKVDMVVTSCMGCMLQFINGLRQEGKSVKVKHLLEILNEKNQ
ncbi:MAG TPA: hypothetical protein PKV48_03835 [Thermodesulfobacteriota bacterium]|nr:hypothetical protein [Thermodesulfobacteriota bacterium]